MRHSTHAQPTTQEDTARCVGLFPMHSKLNHSCEPNAKVVGHSLEAVPALTALVAEVIFFASFFFLCGECSHALMCTCTHDYSIRLGRADHCHQPPRPAGHIRAGGWAGGHHLLPRPPRRRARARPQADPATGLRLHLPVPTMPRRELLNLNLCPLLTLRAPTQYIIR